MSITVLQARSRKAVAVRRGDEDAAREADRDLAAAKLEQYIARVVASAPPLAPSQRSRLIALFDDGAAEPARYSRPAATLAGGDAA